MEQLHQIHEAINKLWQFIKKYSDTSDYGAILAEAEQLQTNNPEITDMLQDWVVRWMKYEDRRKK